MFQLKAMQEVNYQLFVYPNSDTEKKKNKYTIAQLVGNLTDHPIYLRLWHFTILFCKATQLSLIEPRNFF